MLGVLRKILCSHTIARQLCIARKLLVLIDDLLRRAAYFALRTAAIKNAVRDIAATRLGAVAVVLTRTWF